MREKALPEPFSAENLNQLRQRWERDPKSRAFLQLAEEYRRAGRLPDAVHVLQAGLKEHPTYLSAQVALGRCLMESGAPDAAAEILERAVARDPTQLVANKLLVEAYLAKGQAAKARERLDLYKLFNDRDAEIEPLEARIRACRACRRAAKDPLPRRSGASPRSPSLPAAPFELPAVPELPDVVLQPAFAGRRAAGAASTHEPFGRLYPADAAQRIESAFVRQGIFPLAPPAPKPAASTFALVPHPADGAGRTARRRPSRKSRSLRRSQRARSPGSADRSDRRSLRSLRATGSRPRGPTPRSRPRRWKRRSATLQPTLPRRSRSRGGRPASPGRPSRRRPRPLPVSAAPKAASATLGELYLAQGHLDEAEESFQSVLQSRPGDAAALAGLESVRLQRGDEAAFADEIPAAEESNVIVGGLTARKAALLKDYLARIRRGARRHVS